MQKRQEQELIKRYLLGDLDEERLEQIEERLLTDVELQDTLSGAQDHLIDEYVFDLLTENERGLFKRNFLLTPERLHKLRLSQALSKYTEADAADARAVRTSRPDASWQKPFYFLQRHKLAAALSSVVVLLTVSYGGWSVYQRWQLKERLLKLRAQQLEVQQELAKLNMGQAPELPAAVAVLPLRHLLVRDAGENRRAVITSGINVLQLRLELNEDNFPSYRAVIETDDGTGMYTVNNLKAQSAGGNKAVSLNLPSRLLPTGDYQVHLSGTAEKESVDVGVYTFQVVLK